MIVRSRAPLSVPSSSSTSSLLAATRSTGPRYGRSVVPMTQWRGHGTRNATRPGTWSVTRHGAGMRDRSIDEVAPAAGQHPQRARPNGRSGEAPQTPVASRTAARADVERRARDEVASTAGAGDAAPVVARRRSPGPGSPRRPRHRPGRSPSGRPRARSGRRPPSPSWYSSAPRRPSATQVRGVLERLGLRQVRGAGRPTAPSPGRRTSSCRSSRRPGSRPAGRRAGTGTPRAGRGAAPAGGAAPARGAPRGRAGRRAARR